MSKVNDFLRNIQEMGAFISNKFYFNQLKDTPNFYEGYSGDYLVVNDNESGIHFTGIEKIAADLTDYGFGGSDSVTEFSGLQDTPSGYQGHSGDYLVVNDNESGIHFTGIEKISDDLDGKLYSPRLPKYNYALPNPDFFDGRVVASGCNLYYACEGEWIPVKGESTVAPEDFEELPSCITNIDEVVQYGEYKDKVISDNLSNLFSAGLQGVVTDQFFHNVCLYTNNILPNESSSDFFDSSTNNFDVSITEGSIVLPEHTTVDPGPQGSSSISFGDTTATESAIKIPREAFNPKSQDMTLEFWIKLSSEMVQNTSNRKPILVRNLNHATAATTTSVLLNSDNTLVWYSNLSQGDMVYKPSDNNQWGEWNHIALVRNATKMSIYFNGVEVDSKSISATAAFADYTSTYSDFLKIGCWNQPGAGNMRYLPFRMQSIRHSSIARYTSDFQPPTTLFTPDENTQFLINSNLSTQGLTQDPNLSTVKILESTYKWGLIEDNTTINIEAQGDCSFSHWVTNQSNIINDVNQPTTTALIHQDTSITGVFNC